jgi:polyisoprenoid-binding protein YceI
MSTTWKIDSSHTTVGFTARHMMITKVRGRFAEVEGTIETDAADPSAASVRVAIPTDSIDTGVEDRDAHLRSGDFLDVENHPLMTFESTSVEGFDADAGTDFTVVGDLTIAGTTREVVLDATFEGGGQDPWGGERLAFSASTTIDRRDFGLTWNQALETGGVLVGHDVKIELEVQAVQAADAETELEALAAAASA